MTTTDSDDAGEGVDLLLAAGLVKVLPCTVIAFGCCGLAQHLVEGYQAGAAALAAGSFLCQRDQNPMQCRSHIRNAGLPIRLEV